VPISILNRGICEQVLITDVHRGPIEVARRRVEEAGLSDVCRFVLTDGLDDVAPEEGDVLLISGQIDTHHRMHTAVPTSH
jgi:tRNA (adenine22-N1)-methyltransferase